MKTKITNFITALKAEHIKKRGTGFYWTSLVMGIISPILFFIVQIINNTDETKTEIPFNIYSKFIESSLNPFTFFFFPLFIIIMVSRITQIDHKNGGWQLMETQPSYKFSIYFSKFTTILIANLISILSFLIFSIVCSWLLSHIITVPKIATQELPVTLFFSLLLRLFVASLLITAIQYFVSVVISSFIWSILIGFFGLLLTLFLTPLQLAPVWYPYDILSKVTSTTTGSQLGYLFLFTEYISLIGSIIVLYIGFEWYKHKEFKLAFFGNSKRIISVLAVLLLGGGLLFWLLVPNQMKNHNRTIICGTIESKQKFQNIYIRDAIVNDTIAIIPIKNNQFHYEIKENVITDYYEFNFDGQYTNQLFFGTKDSINLSAKLYGRNIELTFKGTRLAENQTNPNSIFDWSMVEYSIKENQNLDEPDKIIRGIYTEWKEELAKPSKFRTIDNYIAKEDFRERSEKLVTTRYLNFWNDLVKKRAALYPDEKTTASPGIKEMQTKLSLQDESLLSNESYFNFVKSQLIQKNNQEVDDNTKAITEISKLKPSSFKDKLLFWQVRKSLEDATSSEERNNLIVANPSKFENKNYQSKIKNVYKEIESIGRGKIAPELLAKNIDGTAVKLSDLKGKYTVIDVWATWCRPCREQAPYFEKMALKYKKEKVQFVSLSIDDDVKKWYIETKTKTKSIANWHINDKELFCNEYNVASIPRFILIDPNGKFVNSKMPQPSDDAFEIILRKTLNLPDEY
ncbi:redoxin domain-containing protein [Flavobacterium sp.]|uniref:redoxin domain-containing protein n=1 Tax=Flavobacterium sp. TaxID=239 RepID=UPI002606504B|nr:redoxin domain-containing protein [Flavobacterium sp.]